MREKEPVCPLLSPAIYNCCTLGSVRMFGRPLCHLSPPATSVSPDTEAQPQLDYYHTARFGSSSQKEISLFQLTSLAFTSPEKLCGHLQVRFQHRNCSTLLKFLNTNLPLGHMEGWAISLSVQLLMTLSQELSK